MNTEMDTNSTSSNNLLNKGNKSYHTYKAQSCVFNQKTNRFEEDATCIWMKKNMNGFALTNQEKAIDTWDDDEKDLMKCRIEAFRSGMILLNPIFECTTCDNEGNWEQFKEYEETCHPLNYFDMRCFPCCDSTNNNNNTSNSNTHNNYIYSQEDDEDGDNDGNVEINNNNNDDESRGQGKSLLSCTTWVYDNKAENQSAAIVILNNDEDRKIKLPDNATAQTRQVVPLLSKNELIQYYCQTVHQLGLRIYHITQIIKHDPILAFNAILHYHTSLPHALAQLNKEYLDRVSYVEMAYFYMEKPEQERFTGKREDLNIPIDYRTQVIEEESDIFIVSQADKVKMMDESQKGA